MELSEEIELPVSLPLVWQALNDPDILQQCLTGCEEFKEIDDNRFAIKIIAKVGPVKARFKGEIELDDIREMESYTLRGGGKGGVAGFAKGEARVSLKSISSPQGDLTVLSYSVKAMVGGKLAHLGSRLVDGAAKKMAAQFFGQFVEIMNEKQASLGQ